MSNVRLNTCDVHGHKQIVLNKSDVHPINGLSLDKTSMDRKLI